MVLAPVLAVFQWRSHKSLAKLALFFVTAGLFVVADVFVYTRLVFGSSVRQVFPVVLAAGGPAGIWGMSWWSTIVGGTGRWSLPWFALAWGLCAGGLLILAWRRAWSIWQTLLLSTLLLYIFLPQWGVQYVFWLVPWLFLRLDQIPVRERRWFWGLSSLYAGLTYLNIARGEIPILAESYIQAVGVALWLYFCFWSIRLVLRWSHQQG